MVVEDNKLKKVKCKRCSEVFEVGNEAKWESDRFPCLVCGETYSILPISESKLMQLQDRFIYYINSEDIQESDKVISHMYLIMESYATSLVKKYFRSYLGKTDFTVEEIGSQAALDLLTNYLERRAGKGSKREYEIRKSFGAQLKNQIASILFSSTEKMTGTMRDCKTIDVPGIDESNFSPERVRAAISSFVCNEWRAEIPRVFNSGRYNQETGLYTVRLFRDINPVSIDNMTEQSGEYLIIEKDKDIRKVETYHYGGYLSDMIVNILEDIGGANKCGVEELNYYVGICIFFESGPDAAEQYYNQYGISGKYWYRQALKIVRDQLSS